jgi:adenylate kinase family enzyme
LLYTSHKNIAPSFALETAIADLRAIITRRLQAHYNGASIDMAAWLQDQFGDRLLKQEIVKNLPQPPTHEEWIVLLLALVPHISADLFGALIAEHLPNGGDFPEFGGVKGLHHRGVLPTGETARFIIAGTDMEKGVGVQRLFDQSHYFYQQDILWLETVREGEPLLSGRIILSPEWAQYLLTGQSVKPTFSADFPARLATTRMSREDLVLHPFTEEQVEDIRRWLRFHHELEADSNLSRKLNAGYRVLFYGPSGTGKTLTATILGKEYGKDVYRIDLSQIVSKYIGETEKNLSKIFDRAQHQDWILFFDEADALFGKRTSVQSSHDKFANQEVSFLLQRIEDFPGLMILASNLKSNIDEAFLRRFHSIVYFPMPNAQERLKLWKYSMPSSLPCGPDVSLPAIAEAYEISGASIINVVQFAALKAWSRDQRLLTHQDLVDGVTRELRKDERGI